MKPFAFMNDEDLLEYYLERQSELDKRLDDYDDEWTDKDEEEWRAIVNEISILTNKQPA